MSEEIIRTGINVLYLLAIAVVVLTILLSLGHTVVSGFEAPPENTTLGILQSHFNRAVETVGTLIGPLVIIGFAVIVIWGIIIVFRMFTGGGGGGEARKGRQ